MRLIFLDVDGVLNKSHGKDEFDPLMMKNLKHIVDSSGSEIVISSDWRRSGANLARLRSELMSYGMNFIDTTPIMNGERRKREIASWLRSNQGWDKAVILDDLDTAHLYKRNKIIFIQTDHKLGLTEEDADKAINFFHKEK